MNRIILALAATAATSLVAGTAMAQTAAGSLTKAAYTANMVAEFSAIDANKDGVATRAEIETWQKGRAVAMATERNKEIFRQLDTDKNGSISAAEFLKAGPPPATPRVDQVMAVLDTNKDGKVSKDEHASNTAAKFNQIDANKDGTVTQAELRAALAAERK